MEPATAQLAVPQQAWQYGVLGVACFVLGVVVVVLFKAVMKQNKTIQAEHKLMSDERTAWALERARWEIDREKIRSESHAAHALLVTEYAKQINAEHKVCQEREDAIREGYDALTKLRSDEQKKTMDALTEALDKLGGKLTPRRY